MATVKTPAGYEFDPEEYYESRDVGTRARSDKECVYCGEDIPKGTPHVMHHFYPEFEAYATHNTANGHHGDKMPEGQKSCEELFMELFKR